MSDFAKVKDIRAGTTLYIVYAFPELGGQGGGELWIEPIHVKNKPFLYDHRGAYARKFWMFDSANDIHPLEDINVVPNTYNFHQLFKCERGARRYLNRINGGRFTPSEQQKLVRLAESEARTMATWGFEPDYEPE